MLNIFKKRYANTPMYWKLFGDAILWSCAGGSIRNIADQGNMYVSIGLFVAGIIGHFLSNLPTDEKKEDDK